MIQPGINLGTHRLLRKIGEGPMADVYLAQEREPGREVVLKILKQTMARQGQWSEDREEEVSPSAMLRHSGIVPLFKSGFASGCHYMTCAFLPGGDLRNRIREGLSARQALTIASQVARALAFAHSKGVTHQALKPENVLFNSRGMAVVSDFSVSKALGYGAGVVSRELAADPRYSGPEEMMGLTKLFGRSDLYALGLMLFEMLTGELPRKRGRTAEEKPPPLPDFAQGYQSILDRLLALRPGNRYASAGVLLEDLEAELKKLAPRGEEPRVVLLPGRDVRAGGAALAAPMEEVFDELEEPLFEPSPEIHAPFVLNPDPDAEVARVVSASSSCRQGPVEVSSRGGKQKQSFRRSPGSVFAAFFAVSALVAAGGWWGYESGALPSLLAPRHEAQAPVVPSASIREAPSAAQEGALSAVTEVEIERARLFKAAPEELRRRFLGALALASGGDPDDAAFIYRRLIADYPAMPEAYNNLAAIQASRGSLELALRTLENGFRAHPSFGVMFENLNTLEIELSLRKAFPEEISPSPRLQLIDALQVGENEPGKASEAVAAPSRVSTDRALSNREGAASAAVDMAELVQVEKVLGDWARFWSSRDAEAYLSYYGSAFEPPGSMTREQWERVRRQRLAAPSRVEVQLERVAAAPIGPDLVRVLALQSYNSNLYGDQTLKEFVLAKEGDRWVIQGEVSLGRLR